MMVKMYLAKVIYDLALRFVHHDNVLYLIGTKLKMWDLLTFARQWISFQPFSTSLFFRSPVTQGINLTMVDSASS